jgi:hypothetical protein
MASDRFLKKRYVRCPVCECTTEMAVRYEAWYGASYYCCRCGDSWCDGEMYGRPLARYWRRDAVQKHRKLWDRATFGPAPTFEELYPEEAA